MTINNPTINQTITDNTVIWTYRNNLQNLKDLTSDITTDLNELKDIGYYKVRASVDHSPFGINTWGNLLVMKTGIANHIIQLGISSGGIYTRWYHAVNGVWSDWKYFATTDDLSNYLPLTGGSMTGGSITRNIDNHTLNFYGGTGYGKGAYLALRGKDNNNGEFELVCDNGITKKELVGSVINGLLWAGNDLGGSAIVAKSFDSNGYIQYASKLIIQWGVKLVESSVTSTYLAFPISFINKCVTCIGSEATDDIPNQNGLLIWNYSKNGCQLITQKPKVYVHWFVIGY